MKILFCCLLLAFFFIVNARRTTIAHRVPGLRFTMRIEGWSGLSADLAGDTADVKIKCRACDIPYGGGFSTAATTCHPSQSTREFTDAGTSKSNANVDLRMTCASQEMCSITCWLTDIDWVFDDDLGKCTTDYRTLERRSRDGQTFDCPVRYKGLLDLDSRRVGTLHLALM